MTASPPPGSPGPSGDPGDAGPTAAGPGSPTRSPAKSSTLTVLLVIGTSIVLLVGVGVLVVASGGLAAVQRSLDREKVHARAGAAIDAGRPADAVPILEAHLEADPDDALAWTLLGNARADLDADEAAGEAFRRALALDAREYRAHTGLGILARKAGRYEDAAGHYEDALEIEPGYASAWSSLAVVELMNHDDGKALAHAEHAWSLDDTDPVVAANLAVVYHCLGRTADRDRLIAVAERLGYPNLETLRDIASGDSVVRGEKPVPALVRQARRWIDTGEADRARAALESHLSGDGNEDDAPAWFLLAEAHRALGATAKAEEAIDRVLALDPDHVDAHVTRGILQRSAGRYDEAMESYARALEISPDDPNILSSMSIIELKRENDDRAVELGERAHALDPENATVAANLAVAHHYVGHARRARELLEEARRLGYGNVEGVEEIFEGKRTIRDE